MTFQGTYILYREPFPILYLHTSSGDQAWLQHIPYLLPGHWGNTEAGHLVPMEQAGGEDNKVVHSQSHFGKVHFWKNTLRKSTLWKNISLKAGSQ